MLKKTAVIVITIAVIASCCCMSVSASTFDTSGTGSQFDSVITMGTISAAQSNNDGSKYWVYYDHNTGSSLQLVRSLEFKLCPGDTFRWDFAPISFYLSNTSTYIRGVSLGLVNSDLQSIVSFAKQDIVGQGTFVVNFGKGTYTNNTVEDQILYLSVNLVGSFFEETGVISWNAFNYSFSCIDADGRLLEKISSEQQQTNEKLDELLQQPEQEKQEALSSGDSNVDSLTSVIPDYSTGFINGMQKLATSLSYNGTECKWKFPQLYIPAMEGVTQKIALTDGEWEIDIGGWVQKLPPTILKIIQIVLTAALILYCVKELYDTVQYALTLKSGGAA